MQSAGSLPGFLQIGTPVTPCWTSKSHELWVISLEIVCGNVLWNFWKVLKISDLTAGQN